MDCVPLTSVNRLLIEQIEHEFTASQQYTAFAVWFDQQALPQLAQRFYEQALEERNHAMMIVAYLLDRDIDVTLPAIPALAPIPASVTGILEFSVEQEQAVTRQFEQIIAAARNDQDYLAEQFTHWFLKEQVEEVSSMSTLLQVATRCGDNLMLLEDYLAREVLDSASDPTAPRAAGGAAALLA
ncbi:MAG: ferritin [Actinobacteria bacterium]|nr:ferritin [Actinomycetota bacterium]